MFPCACVGYEGAGYATSEPNRSWFSVRCEDRVCRLEEIMLDWVWREGLVRLLVFGWLRRWFGMGMEEGGKVEKLDGGHTMMEAGRWCLDWLLASPASG